MKTLYRCGSSLVTDEVHYLLSLRELHHLARIEGFKRGNEFPFLPSILSSLLLELELSISSEQKPSSPWRDLQFFQFYDHF